MKISDNGIKLIKSFEGCRLKAYRDAVNVLTIGYGHTGDVKLGQVISQAKADELLKEDLARFEKYVMAYDSKYHWNQNQFDALVSFAFNIGNIHQLTAKGTRSIAEISNAMLLYDKAGGTRLAGLSRRRRAEKALFDKVSSSTSSSKHKSNDTIAKEVIAGKWGNGEERKKKLKAAGYDYNTIQKLVNKLLR